MVVFPAPLGPSSPRTWPRSHPEAHVPHGDEAVAVGLGEAGDDERDVDEVGGDGEVAAGLEVATPPPRGHHPPHDDRDHDAREQQPDRDDGAERHAGPAGLGARHARHGQDGGDGAVEVDAVDGRVGRRREALVGGRERDLQPVPGGDGGDDAGQGHRHGHRGPVGRQRGQAQRGDRGAEQHAGGGGAVRPGRHVVDLAEEHRSGGGARDAGPDRGRGRGDGDPHLRRPGDHGAPGQRVGGERGGLTGEVGGEPAEQRGRTARAAGPAANPPDPDPDPDPLDDPPAAPPASAVSPGTLEIDPGTPPAGATTLCAEPESPSAVRGAGTDPGRPG